jgi:hypothetical protein
MKCPSHHLPSHHLPSRRLSAKSLPKAPPVVRQAPLLSVNMKCQLLCPSVVRCVLLRVGPGRPLNGDIDASPTTQLLPYTIHPQKRNVKRIIVDQLFH